MEKVKFLGAFPVVGLEQSCMQKKKIYLMVTHIHREANNAVDKLASQVSSLHVTELVDEYS